MVVSECDGVYTVLFEYTLAVNVREIGCARGCSEEETSGAVTCDVM